MAHWVAAQFRMISYLGWLKNTRGLRRVQYWCFEIGLNITDANCVWTFPQEPAAHAYDVLGTPIRFVPRQGAEWRFGAVSVWVFQFYNLSLRMCCWLELSFPQTFKILRPNNLSRIFPRITVVVFLNQKRCRRLYSSWDWFVQFASDFCGWVSQKSDGDAKGFREGEATPAKILMFSTSVTILPIQYQSWRQSFMPEILTEVNQMYKPRWPTLSVEFLFVMKLSERFVHI